MRFLTIATMLALSACSNKGSSQADNLSQTSGAENTVEVGDLPTSDTEQPVQDTQLTDAWSVSDEIDPMNDDRVIKAQTTAQGNVNDIQVTVICKPGGPAMGYTINGFDKEEEGARVADVVFNKPGVQLRADSDKPVFETTWDQRYTNQVTILSNAVKAARADTLTLRIQFSNAVETYSLDQTTANFRNAVAPCLVATDRENQKKEQAKLEAERQAEQESMRAPAFDPNGNGADPDQTSMEQ